jgi:hypothetical protein
MRLLQVFKNIVLAISLLGLFAFLGCIAPIAVSEHLDMRAETEAKSFVPYPNKAVIYIFRGDSYIDHTELFINNRHFATIQKANFVRVVVPPGRYEFKSDAKQNWALTKKVSLDAKAGQIYYFRDKITTSPFIFIFHSLKPWPEAKSQDAIYKYSLVTDWYVE